MKNSAGKLVFRTLQWSVLLAIIAYLFYDVRRNAAFQILLDSPKQWDLLAASLAVMLAAVTLLIFRWHLLVRALDLPLKLRDSLRLGFLGYLLNFVSLGAVGGDLFKAIFVAREVHGHRPEAVATVVVDRLIGLYGVFILATIAILATGAWEAETNANVRLIYRATFITTAVMTVAFHLLLLPVAMWDALGRWASRIPKIGSIGVRLIEAVQLFRRRFGVLVLAAVLTIVAQAMVAAAFYLLSAGLLAVHPSLASHMVIVPLATVAGVLPLPLNGLGAMEAVIEFMYRNVPGAIEGTAVVLPKGVGVLVSLGNRIVQVLIALVGMIVYLMNRREVATVMHEVHEEEAEGHTLLEAEDGDLKGLEAGG